MSILVNREYKLEERLLTVKDLNLHYGDKVVLRDVNLVIDNIVRPNMSQGQSVALLGPSGIGKTQLFRCIAGLQRPSSGSVKLQAETEEVRAGDVGVVQQSYPLLGHRTIMGNLKLASKDTARIEELLKRFDLDQHADKYPSQISGGQRQRIAIIQQIICSKHFLLMDEPFSGLDIIAKEKVCDVLNEVNVIDELNTTIFTTHDIESAVMIADTIWVMGREEGKPGATIVKTLNLIERGLAWQPDIEHHPLFAPFVQEVKDLFKTL